MQDRIVCPKCGTANHPDSQYCDQCSAPLKALAQGLMPGRPVAGGPGPSSRPAPLPVWPASAPAPAAAAVPAPPPSPSAPAPSVAPPVSSVNVAPAPARAHAGGGPPLLLVGGALLALAVFIITGVFVLVNSGTPAGGDPGTSARATAAAVDAQTTALAVQQRAVQSTQTAVAMAAVPPPSPTAGPAATAAPTTAAGSPVAQGGNAPVPTPAGTFVIPTPAPTVVPTPVAFYLSAGSDPKFTGELTQFFTLYYKARSVAPGQPFDITTVRNLTAQPYRDYTLSLLLRNQADVRAGKIKSIGYSDISVNTLDQKKDTNGDDVVTVDVARTIQEEDAGSEPVAHSGTFRYRARRTLVADGRVTWRIYDAFNDAKNQWASQAVDESSVSTSLLQSELADFFTRFYAARSLAPGSTFDLATMRDITAQAYAASTLPLLQLQQEAATAGQIDSIAFSDIQIKLEAWDPHATDHGGNATVSVTRTARIVHGGQAEPLDVETHRYLVHRHQSEEGRGFWIVTDYELPTTGKWLSQSAGASVPLPAPGHGE